MAALCALVLFAMPQALAETPSLGLPIDCTPGETCWIAKYVDIDPTESMKDYACGRLAGNGHKGTDFALRDMTVMERGVDVLASASGTVTAVRDGMRDISTRRLDDPSAIKGRDCGNGVMLDHGNGWQTQYCHLKNGSVAVTPGDAVAAGDRLGQVGLSGMTEFPHVHLTVRFHGITVDPFLGLSREPGCGTGAKPLWRAELLDAIDYQPVALYNVGFSPEQPEQLAARDGAYRDTRYAPGAPGMFLWADMFGSMVGDALVFGLEGPGVSREVRARVEDSKLQRFQLARFSPPAGGWPPGDYTGTVTAIRDGVAVEARTTTTVEDPSP